MQHYNYNINLDLSYCCTRKVTLYLFSHDFIVKQLYFTIFQIANKVIIILKMRKLDTFKKMHA